MSLLPQTEEDVLTVKKLSLKHPEKVMQRLNYLMTEMNFLIDVFDFQKGDPRCKLIVQQQVEQIIETAAAKGLLDLAGEERAPV